MDEQARQKAIEEIMARYERQVSQLAQEKEKALKELVLRAREIKVAKLSQKIKGKQ